MTFCEERVEKTGKTREKSVTLCEEIVEKTENRREIKVLEIVRKWDYSFSQCINLPALPTASALFTSSQTMICATSSLIYLFNAMEFIS